MTNPNIQAFLNLIGRSEGADYNILYGGKTFSDYSKHPNIKVTKNGITSTAAGKYQFLYGTWLEMVKKLGLIDFSPASQDLAAIQRIKDRGAYNLIIEGKIADAISVLSKEWASFPYAKTGASYYGQGSHSLANLMIWYNSFFTLVSEKKKK